MAPLAKLPVFWALEGKRVIVTGGSDAAAWKAELLAACGAEVHVYAQKLSEMFEVLIARPAEHPGGRFIHHALPWHRGIFAGAELAVADCEDEADAMALASAARAAGVPVNVIDKPAFCRFQFGSIVNRSPVVVSISTDGAAPVLAQAIRRRIETSLPQSLQAWAEIAQSLRETINKRLLPGQQRRSFWERFVHRAFGPAPDGRSEAAILADVTAVAAAQNGKGRATLIATHPDDAELLTLKAVRALQAADIILYDDRISPDVLELARREAERRPVERRQDLKITASDDIIEAMAASANAGKNVVRLTVDDSAASREIAFLTARGIPINIIPGVVAANTAPSCRERRERKFKRNIPLGAGGPDVSGREPAQGSNG
ncbi:NAD(P)-dependent oxidoreductase [Rhizobium populisoli]|uniref:NAD(P)-dependent oxidoreductase n=1 Tax=Rhizobium populisoli TaxID=2859785 RepID=UPI0028ADA8DB|nr:SAM-dependent methyltransferase [Rhizobium populisoli]